MYEKDLMAKVVAWRLVSITITLLVMFLVTGNIGKATGITICLHALLTVAHYTFEKLWAKNFRRNNESSYS